MTEAEQRVAERFQSRFFRSYAKSKLKRDPVYRAVFERLHGSTAPVVDIGCGTGLLEFFLRERGFSNPIVGIDHDARKIAEARSGAREDEKLEFRAGDAREAIPVASTVVLIDVLHYFSDDDQQQILRNAMRAGGLVIIRDAIRESTLRFRVTAAQERLARLIRWNRSERLNFPTRGQITAPFEGYVEEVTPMWGGTPFNNYLFVFSRSIGGMTKR